MKDFINLVKLANMFRRTPIVDDDFPQMRDNFDKELTRLTFLLESADEIVECLDITGAENVEVSLREDCAVIWVNVDGICRLRICRIENLVLQDARPKKSDSDKPTEDKP